MSKLFVFDMDGTLLPKTTASIEISRQLGKLPELLELERQFAEGVLNTKMFAQEINRIWGVLDETVIRSAFEASSKLANIDTVISILSERGDKSCIITMSPDFFANLFLERGFDFVFASEFPRTVDEPLCPERILTPEDKVSLTKRLCDELGVDIVDVVAFGDSMSDYPLFKTLVHTVSVNGTPHLEALAKYRYRGNDLHEIFRLHEL